MQNIDYAGQKPIQFDPFNESSHDGFVFGKPGAGKSFPGTKNYEKYRYQKECEEVENAPIQFYR